jgi:hypothetical protein
MPNFDYPPNDLVQLGQIVTSPKEPYHGLAAPFTPIPRLQRNTKKNYLDVVAKARKGEVGLWLQFMASIFGAGADVSASWAHEHAYLLQFRELETLFFEPDEKYLTQSLQNAVEIMQYIKSHPRRSVYMVTGLKIARGAACGVKAKQALGLGVKLGADATAFTGVPVQGGPAFKTEGEKSEAFYFDGSSDFVFAYRLRRIIVTYKGNIKGKSYEKGAETLGNHHEVDEDDDREENEEEEDLHGGNTALDPEISALFLEDVDFGTNGVPFEATSVEVKEEGLDEDNDDDDNATCTLIVPGEKED